MLEFKSWENKIVTKYVKGEEMLGFVKPFDHYQYKF